VLHWKGKLLALPALPSKIIKAHSFPDGAPVTFVQNNDGVVLTLPDADKNPDANKSEVDRVIVLTTGKS
jgi:hypothetical protein